MTKFLLLYNEIVNIIGTIFLNFPLLAYLFPYTVSAIIAQIKMGWDKYQFAKKELWNKRPSKH